MMKLLRKIPWMSTPRRGFAFSMRGMRRRRTKKDTVTLTAAKAMSVLFRAVPTSVL